MSRPVRLLVVPLILFATVSGAAYGLAQLHPARPGTPKTSGKIVLGDAYNGQLLFEQTCAGCHGDGGTGGGIGPRLKGSSISLAEASARIRDGGGTMPANLVRGRELRDVLAYLRTMLRAG
ncbi:MAG: c-type cytochrome [Gaiellaceae bacterium]